MASQVIRFPVRQAVRKESTEHLNRSNDTSRLEQRDAVQDVSHARTRPGTRDSKSGMVVRSREQQHAVQDVSHAGTRDNNSGMVIQSMEQLSKAIELGNLPQVQRINLDAHDIGSRHVTLADALASGQMSALEQLWLRDTRLTGDCCGAICNAMTLGKFPKLTHMDLASNEIGTEGVEALGRAIQSGNLKTLAQLFLYSVAINDDHLATLATAFQYGDVSVLPNLWRLDLEGNSFTEVGLQSLAEALKSGRLDSLRSLDVRGPTNLSEEGANALVSAFAVNNCLTVAVDIGWNQFPDLHRRCQQLRDRNIKRKANFEKLSKVPMVPGAFGKVYLCGSPEVGKTTLRRTLQRTFWQSLWTWERRPHVEQRTRGIDVSQFSSRFTKKQGENPVTLCVWDMAGQQDYHLVHNAFFPDLSSAEGKATIFVIVCNSKDLDKAEQQLEYWLKYIASSCHKTTRRLRHVFVVMNNIAGDQKVQGYEQDWKIFVDDQSEKFTDFLDVHTTPFVVDVRRRQKVDCLKSCLLEQSRNFLKEVKVPEICKIIQMNLFGWSEARQDFPVVDWVEFVGKVQTLDLFSDQTFEAEETIEAATKYLNEAGVLIYIDKSFPSHWGIPYRRFVVLNPNWFCNRIIGDIFLSKEMVGYGEQHRLFRKKVNEMTGSVSISDFKGFFKSRWTDQEFEDLIVLLLWLGLCYKGKQEDLFIPSLIDKNGKPGDQWQPQSAYTDEEDPWVMGFSILHKKSEMTLAPMTLWHRYQVELAQTSKFNGDVVDNDFVAGKYFMTFTLDYMNVLIEVDATEDFPTFNEITILVKPVGKEEDVTGYERKQFQVNLAGDLVDILLGLWDDICGGVQYVHKVVWPWPVSQSRQKGIQDRNVEVAQVRRDVQMHGMGKKMHWSVGRDYAIRYDQLLSTNGKYSVIKSAEDGITVSRKIMVEAVKLRIYPPELTEESTEGVSHDESELPSHWIEEATQPISPNTRRILNAVKEVGGKVDTVVNKLNDIEKKLQEGFAKVLKEQKTVLRKVLDIQKLFKEDKERTCPNLIYLAEKETGAWVFLNDALSTLSPAVKIRLKFACEAGYDNYRPHFVLDQHGLVVSALKPAFKKIAPWLKVSLTILLISAKIGTNIVAPGAGLIVPDFQQFSSLFDGIVWATGYPMQALDKLLTDEMGLDANDTHWNPQDVYGKSREAITDLIEKSARDRYEQNCGLRKVSLNYSDGSLHGVVWICTKCLVQFRNDPGNLVTEL